MSASFIRRTKTYVNNLCTYWLIEFFHTPGGIRTYGFSLRSSTDFGLFLSISDGFSGFLSEKKKHYVDICRFESARVEGFY